MVLDTIIAVWLALTGIIYLIGGVLYIRDGKRRYGGATLISGAAMLAAAILATV